MEEFDFPVDNATRADASFSTLSAGFGDGYTQDAGDGINIRREAWQVSAAGHWTDGSGMPVKEMSEFLDRHGGSKAFQWETPLGKTKLFKCRGGYSLDPEGAGNFKLMATFREVFHP
ncbi:phage tail protein [Halopseudomonas sp. SMJS2]|uniref:phage tail protein n=1 Tax=Halopseudomonas sp. SMJS2 TaxID=3041098 RepID=UPI002452FE3A|nr:phage tail protein [Halopseudomonas sp. SMJS2]WGK60499.1 phage tail protein [Halopseudomonas sp. SMJS2]